MISVIVPAKDAAKTLGDCLEALLNQEGLLLDHDYEVIVVDDGSIDDTAHIGQQHSVKVVRQANAGPAAARNAGARIARGTLLAFTDADCTPSPNWLRNLTRPFHDPQVTGVKGVYRTRQTGLVSRFVQLEYEYKYARMRDQAGIDFIDTYSAAYRKEVFLLNEGFDESFRVPSVEDQELSFRLARKGYWMVFEPSAVVYHVHDRTLSEYLRRKFVIGYWKAFMLRWIPEKTLSDSHTAPSQRAEILLLAALLAALPFFIPWPFYTSVFILIILALFFIATSPFLMFIHKWDTQVLWISPGMLLGRAAALGLGLLKGFILPQKTRPEEFPCLSMQVRLIKRLVDIAGASMGLLLSAPVIALAALAIRLDSPGPVFFRQARAGESGKPYILFKLRTMVASSDRMTTEVLQKGKLNGQAAKDPDDPHITRVGRHLRRWSLDELPQFWNVLIGEMSLVGPRPEELRIVDLYNDYQRQRLMVRPGLTGPTQVNGRCESDFDKRLEMELNYLRKYKLVEDFKIIFKTFQAFFPEGELSILKARPLWFTIGAILFLAASLLITRVGLPFGGTLQLQGTSTSLSQVPAALQTCGSKQAGFSGPLTPDRNTTGSDRSFKVVKTDEKVPEIAWSTRAGFSISSPADPTHWAGMLGSGWYLDWTVQPPPALNSLEYWPMIRVHEDCIYPSKEEIQSVAARFAGQVWIIGNEPDVIWQDSVKAAKYASIYHDLYLWIKSTDSSALIAVGGVSQATPLRLQYLDQVLQAYQNLYNEPMPVDWWTVHGYVLREEKGSWGVDIPPGIDVTRGELREVKDHGRIDLFEAQLQSFRQWMAEHGYQNTPLALTEFGILMPASYGFPTDVVAGYLEQTFTWLFEVQDDSIGYPRDGYRLVQKWAWFSISDPTYATSNLGDITSGDLTLLGEMFRRTVAAIVP